MSWLAGLLWNGPPRRLIEYAFDGVAVELFSSPRTTRRTAANPGLAQVCRAPRTRWNFRKSLVENYRDIVSLVIPKIVPRIVMNDTDDDHVIAAALAARVEFIVSGDRRHLLPLGSYQGIGIVMVSDIVGRIGLPPVSA